MTIRRLAGSVLMLAALALPTAAFASPIVFDLAGNWSDGANPNGVWSYNDGAGAIGSHVPSWVPGAFVVPQPAYAAAAFGSGHIVSWFKSLNDAFDFQVGDVVTHTWDGANGAHFPHSSVTWTSPGAGTIDVFGGVWLARSIGRAANWALDVNGASISGGALFDGDAYDRANPFSLATGSGGAGVLNNIAVAAGDVVRLQLITTSTFGEFVGVNLAVSWDPKRAVPEPATLSLVSVGLLLAGLRVGLRARRRTL